MPRNVILCALVFIGGCRFDADYGGGTYTCTDGRCPSGLTCDRAANLCVAPPEDGGVVDVPLDIPPDMMIDARIPALTCADPGELPATGGTPDGTTMGRNSTISASCAGFVMNGPDAVYRIMAGAGDQYLIGITGVKAYVIAPCSPVPATPGCVGNVVASPGNPAAVTTTFAGAHFIVVDHENPATSAAYTLTVTKQ